VSDALRTVSSPDLQFTIVARVTDGIPGMDPEGVLDVKRLSIVTYR